MGISDLVNLTSRAWALPILAAMGDGVPGRPAPLLARTGAGRTAFGHSLDHLIELGMVERNPGHGHPLRPEIRLTDRGAATATLAAQIIRAVPDPTGAALLRHAWSAPILKVADQPRYFVEFKAALPGITDRALSQSLKRLTDAQWLAREVETDSRPPRPLYSARDTGRAISTLLAA